MITVEFRRHPLVGEPEVVTMHAGNSVLDAVQAVSQVACDVDLVRFDAAGVPHAWPVDPMRFAVVRPTAGTIVRVRPRVRAAVVPLLAQQLVTATGMSLLASQVVVGLAVSALALLASYMLYGVGANPNDRKEDAQNPTINGLQNVMATRSTPVPLPLGRIRMAPVRVATGYADLVGQTVYRRERMVFGPGPLALHDLKIGETAIHNFDGVQIQLRNIDEAETLAHYPELGDMNVAFLDDGDTMTLYRRTIYEDVDGARLDFEAAEVRDTPANTAAANVQFYFAGLVKINKSGDKLRRRRQIGVYYRPAAGGDWVTVSEKWYSGRTTSTLRFGVRIEFPEPGAWSVKVVRLSKDNDDVKISDDSYLEAVQSEIEGDMPSPAGVAEIALRIKASEQLAGALDPVNAVVQQMAPVWNGTSFGSPEPVRHPADIYVHLLRADYRRKPVPDERIALDAIRAWKQAWPDWRCDMVVASDKQLGELVREVLATGLAIPAQVDGRHTLLHDRSDRPAVQMFTPRNTANYRMTWNAPPEVHGFRLVFGSERAGWADDEMIVYANGYSRDNATEIETLQPLGLALSKSDDPTRLAQWAYYHLAQVKTRLTEVSFTADLDHIVCSRGDPVIFLSDALRNMIGAGRVLSKTTSGADVAELVLDEVPEDGITAHVAVRSSSGRLQHMTAVSASGVWVVEPGSGVCDLPQGGAFDATRIAPGDLAAVYEHATEPQKWLVKELVPEFGERATLTLAEATTVPLDDMSRPLPEYDPKVIPANTPLGLDYAIEYDGGEMYVVLRWTTLDPAVDRNFRVRLEDAHEGVIDEKWTSQKSARFAVQSAIAETLTGTVWGRLSTGQWSAPATVAISTAEQFQPPDSVENFQARVRGDTLHLTWAVGAANVQIYKIRYSPKLSGAAWSTALPLAEASGDRVAVPARNGTYLIKAVTLQGAESTVAVLAIVKSVGAAFNVIETLAIQPAFSGTMLGGDGAGTGGLTVDGGKLAFYSDGNVFDMANVFDVDNIFIWGRDNLTATYTAAGIVDLGVVDTARIAVDVDLHGYLAGFNVFDIDNIYDVDNVFGDDGGWSAVVQISSTDDDPSGAPVWSDWQDLVVGDYQARAWRFRIVFVIDDPQIVIEVSKFEVIVDMQDRIEKGADIVVPVGGVTVVFDPAFRVKPAIIIEPQGLPEGGRSVRSAASAAGFTLNFYNSAGAAVAGTADWTAIGYGRQGA